MVARDVLNAMGTALIMSSLSGCVVVDALDPLNYVYAGAVYASGGYDDTSSNSVQDLSETSNSANLQALISRETPDRYRPRNCDYIEMALSEVPSYLASSNAMLKQAGEARKVAASQVWQEKGCTLANFSGGKIGASIETIDPHSAALHGAPTSGVLIYGSVAGSPANRAGITANDVVVAINGETVADTVDFRVAVGKSPVGSTIILKVWRYQTFQNVPVVVGTGDSQMPVLPFIAPETTAGTGSSGTHVQGMSLGAVTPSYATAVGLSNTEGAWVIETIKGSAADIAGIRALDVIVEIGGQEVASANDVSDISARMRAGYKTTVSVWRNKAIREVQLILKNE